MHADVNERVVVETQTVPWLATADGEGACKPLDSLEAGASTTSLVQVPAGAVFAPPGGALGEEILARWHADGRARRVDGGCLPAQSAGGGYGPAQ